MARQTIKATITRTKKTRRGKPLFASRRKKKGTRNG